MKFLFVSPLIGAWAGSEWLWSETALRLQESGHQVAFYTPWAKSSATVQSLRRAGTREFTGNLPIRWPRRLWRRYFDRRDIPHRVLAEFGPDLVLLSQPRQDEGLSWLPVFEEFQQPYAVVNQLVVDDLYIETPLADAMSRLYAQARGVWFVAERNRRTLELQLGIALPTARIARNPCRVGRDVPFLWPTGETLRLAMVARIDPDMKGHDVMLEVMARKPWRDRSLTLHIYGEGSGLERLRRVQGMLGLTKVFFEGFATDLAGVWSQNHIVAVPSRQEGTPIAMVEGMLMGRPVLGSAVAGIPEFVEDGISGFIFRAPDPELLDQALHRLWDNRERLPEMGRAAQARARRLVPTDPVQVFADQLIEVAASRRP